MPVIRLAGLDVLSAGRALGEPGPAVVLLHGLTMTAADLSPFGESLGMGVRFLFPEGPIDLTTSGSRGRAWFPMDETSRAEALARGVARDLSHAPLPGLAEGRERLLAFLDALDAAARPDPLVIGGFSQGAMLTCDVLLHEPHRAAALVLLSGARVTAARWAPLLPRLAGVPVFQSHGRQDPDLAFAAAASLKDDLKAAGADVTWVPFDGGHEIPLVVWRELRRFLARRLPRIS